MEKYFEKVYAIAIQIPEGKVVTYGQIAAMLGNPRNARIVGWAMHSAPKDIPCHRVVNKAGDLSPKHGFCDKAIQKIMLEQEGITFRNDGKIDMKKHLWDGNI